MPNEVEGIHKIGETSLFSKSWIPDENPVAKLIFVHGFNDHICRYYELFPILASRGIAVYGFDQRGWGQSVKINGDRGKTGPTTLVISDIADFLKSHLTSDVPVFLMGHSMGGGQVLTLACDPQYEELIKQVRGWLLESPFIAFPKGFEPNPVEVIAATWVSKLLPNIPRLSALPANTVTRDPEVIKSIEEDKLLHGYGTLQGLAHMIQRAKLLSTGTAKISPSVKSLWLAHGTADEGTSYEGSKKWFEEQGDKPGWTFKTYEGWSHQLHADLPETRPIFAKDVADWILAQVNDGQKATSKL